MAQRGGCVTSHLRFGDKVYSSLITPGTVDVLLSFESVEAMRYVHWLKPGGLLVYNAARVTPSTVSSGADEYPEGIEEQHRRGLAERPRRRRERPRRQGRHGQGGQRRHARRDGERLALHARDAGECHPPVGAAEDPGREPRGLPPRPRGRRRRRLSAASGVRERRRLHDQKHRRARHPGGLRRRDGAVVSPRARARDRPPLRAVAGSARELRARAAAAGGGGPRRVQLAGHRLLVARDTGDRSAGRAELHAAAGVAAGRDLLHPGPADRATSSAGTRCPRSMSASAGTCCFGTRTASAPKRASAGSSETHAPEVCSCPASGAFFSYRVVDDDVRLPGVWRDGGAPPPETGATRVAPALRTVVRFADATGAGGRPKAAALTPPPWATQPALPLRRARPRLRQFVPARAADRRVSAATCGAVPAVSDERPRSSAPRRHQRRRPRASRSPGTSTSSVLRSRTIVERATRTRAGWPCSSSDGGSSRGALRAPRRRRPAGRAPPPGHRPPHPRREARRLRRSTASRLLPSGLRGLGADIVWDLRVHEDVKVLFLRDDTGNLVELVEPVEPLTTARAANGAPWRASVPPSVA